MRMLELTSGSDLRRWRAEQRAAGRRVGFVPTMGFLHEGHLALVDEARRRRSDVVAVSIFVNPLQFGPDEDLGRYPRDLPHDRELAKGRGVDLLFVPDVATMYPPGSTTRVVPGPMAERWEGAVRPGHFAGVLTVVAKLFHLVQPDVAVFGQKDVQQATLIGQMVRDLDWPVELVVAPTVREADGLALSSRNVYLSAAARADALALSRALAAAHEAWRAGERSAPGIEGAIRRVLEVHPGLSVDYISVVSPDDLAPVTTVDASTVVALAARVGGTRLIDNIILGEGLGPCSVT
jgi:pantoate--beta-alanine ligase